MKIQIRRQWNSYKIATVLLESLQNIHWDNISGGTSRRAPQQFLHGYVFCTAMEEDFDHACMHGEAPHLIKVCITKKDNTQEAYQDLLKIAGPRSQKIKL
ncbi:MAG: hypothetical protein ACREBA_09250 [Nitrosotalea sp.]